MATKFDKPYLEKSEFDKFKIGEMFNLASNFDLEGLRRHSLVEKIPFNVLNDNNENLIHVIVRTSGGTIEQKRLKIIKYLVSKGLNPDLPNNQDITPLHLACENQYNEIIVYLLKCGSNPNSKDNYGRTPIHYLVSGLIKEWENKTNKPLYYGTRRKEPKDLFKSKVAFKNKIYELIQPNVKDNLDKFKLAIEDYLNEIFILEDFKLEDTLSTSDMNEKLKTKIKEIKDAFEENFKFNLDDLYYVVEGEEDEEVIKISVEEIIQNDIEKNKENMIEEVNKSSKILLSNLDSCKSLPEVDLTYMDKKTKRVKDSKKYLLDKISPFYPGLLKLEDSYFFVSNSQTEISYKPFGDLVGLKDAVNDNNLFRMIYLWFKQTFRNQDALIDIPRVIPRFELDEKLDSIKRKLEQRALYQVGNNFEKLETLLLLTLVCYFYSPSEIDNILELGDFEFTEGTRNRKAQYQYITQFIPKMKNNMEGFFFEVFYYLIEQDIIIRPGDTNKKIFTTGLHLLRMLMDKSSLLEYDLSDNFQTYLSSILQYELLPEDATTPPPLQDDNLDKKYLDVRDTDNEKIIQLLRRNDDYLGLLNEARYKSILAVDEDIANIFSNKNEQIYYTKIFSWIAPSHSDVLAHHYLIRNLDETSLNQSFNIKKSLDKKVDFLGDLSNTIPLSDDVETRTPEYEIPRGASEEKKYLVKDTLERMLLNNICSLNKVYLSLLYEGKFPLLKIFDEKNKDKFNKYFNRVVPYHFKFLYSLELLTRNILIYYNKTNKERLKLVRINYQEKIENINNISMLNYLLVRLKSDSETIEIPNFYYYGIESDNLTQNTILSYGADDGSIELAVPDTDEFSNIFLKGKINTQKLRISRETLPESLKNPKGINLLRNLSVIKSLPEYSDEMSVNDILRQMKVKQDIISLDSKVEFLNKTTKEIINDIYSKYLDLQIIGFLEGKEPDLRALIAPIKEQTELNVDFLKSTDLKFTITQEKRKVSLFPIIEENKLDSPELYFSNDYTSDEFVTKLFEIKYDDNSLKEIIKYGGNPFIIDFTEQSPIHLITTNYLVKPYQTLTVLGVDLRQEDENGFNFTKKVEKEIEYHESFVGKDTSLRKMISHLINPFVKDIKSKIDKSELTRFNKLRYTRMALELPVYYLLANEDIIDKLPSKIYPSDLVLAKHLVKPGTKTRKTNSFTKPTGETILEKHQNFLTIFFDSPGVFIDEFENVIKSEDNKTLISLDKIKEEEAKNYFISDKLITNSSVKKVYDILELVTKQILTTQLIYLLTNMINAHLKIKFPTLRNEDRARIIEEDILGKIVTRGEINQNLLDIIKNEALPKLLRTTIEFYLDDIDRNEAEEYSVYELTSEISEVLGLIPVWFNSKDKLLTEVIPNFLNGYMEIYIPEVMRYMRCVIENVLKLKINYEKVKKLKNP